jgi:hypothetical protein
LLERLLRRLSLLGYGVPPPRLNLELGRLELGRLELGRIETLAQIRIGKKSGIIQDVECIHKVARR